MPLRAKISKRLSQQADTAGQERFQSLVPMYYRGAHVALIVYDITNTDSYKRAKIWVKEIEEKGMTNVIIIFIGNKRDLEGTRTVEIDKSEKYCLKKKITYLETSSKTGYNIKELFQIVGEKLSQATFNDLEKPKMDFERQTYKSDFETTNKNKGCC
ncbi:ras-related protein rab-26 [Anaeramoeba flamelloides]|uniref:Ras-related protein rab-26 n=1 Tax=Anaeramoeba flamelloides TaxID=1746091 RepID=A0AAV7YSB9_9EUKA|nr:ras-related protein rab-26 [Anaeramoeba flamelloides]